MVQRWGTGIKAPPSISVGYCCSWESGIQAFSIGACQLSPHGDRAVVSNMFFIKIDGWLITDARERFVGNHPWLTLNTKLKCSLSLIRFQRCSPHKQTQRFVFVRVCVCASHWCLAQSQTKSAMSVKPRCILTK